VIEKPVGFRDVSLSPRVGQAVADLAARQHGVVARAQLRALGLDRQAVKRRVASGILHPLHEGRVFTVSRAPLSSLSRYLAAVLACGSRAALSHRSAANVWGLRPNATHVEVTVAMGGAGVPGVRVHRSRMLEPNDFTVRDGIPVTSLARTLLDLSAVVRAPELLNAIDRAERLGLFDLTAVVEVLERSRGRKGARALRRAVAAYRPSTQKSELERRFKQLLEEAADIPSPSFNALVDGETGTHEVDAFWPDDRLAVQVDGFAFHRTRRDRERDAASDADLELAGHRVLRLTWDDVNVHGARTLRRVRIARS
jgi:very-short-patch-repair endonuclease